MADDDDDTLDALRRAAYSQGGALSGDDRARLAELEDRALQERGRSRIRSDDGASAAASAVAVAADEPPHVGAEAPQGAAEHRRRSRVLSLGWLAVAAVALIALGYVLGASVGRAEQADEPLPYPALSGDDIRLYVAGDEPWFEVARQAADWDAGSPQYLGAVQGVQVLVGAIDDGERWCHVLVGNDISEGSVESGCRAASQLGHLVRLGDERDGHEAHGDLYLHRDPEFGAFMMYSPLD